MNYGKLTAGTTKTAIDTAKPSEKGEIITYLSRMGDVLHQVLERKDKLVVCRSGLCAVIVVVDCNKANTEAGEYLLDVVTSLNILTTKTRKVFHHDAVN